MIYRGEIINQINHTCDNRRCVNPDHLYDGTPADNMRDAIERDRLNPFRIIDAATVNRMIEMRLRGISISQIAKQFGFNVKTIGSLFYNRGIYVNTYVTDDEVQIIRSLRSSGMTFKDIANSVGRTLGSVKSIFYKRGT